MYFLTFLSYKLRLTKSLQSQIKCLNKFYFRLKFHNTSIVDNNVPRVRCGTTVPGRPRAGDSVISATHRHPPLHGRPRDTPPNRSLSSKPYTRFQLKEHVLCNEPGDLSPVWMRLFMFAFCSINTTLSLSRAIAPPPPSTRSRLYQGCVCWVWKGIGCGNRLVCDNTFLL